MKVGWFGKTILVLGSLFAGYILFCSMAMHIDWILNS